jgi:hypothetical protein
MRDPAQLLSALVEWRDAYREESHVKLVTSVPPVTSQVQADNTVIVEEEPAAAIGMNLSGAMVRLLGHPEGYGRQFEARRALHAWTRFCRSRHARWPDHRGEATCSSLAWMLIRDGYGLSFSADLLDVSLSRAARMLDEGLTWMAAEQERRSTKLDRSTSHDREMCRSCREEDAIMV